MSIAQRRKKLYQSCHILHKRGRYVILSFRELFKLDGKSNFTESDFARRNTIAKLLHDWNLVQIKELDVTIEEHVVQQSHKSKLFITKKKLNGNWLLNISSRFKKLTSKRTQSLFIQSNIDELLRYYIRFYIVYKCDEYNLYCSSFEDSIFSASTYNDVMTSIE